MCMQYSTGEKFLINDELLTAFKNVFNSVRNEVDDLCEDGKATRWSCQCHIYIYI